MNWTDPVDGSWMPGRILVVFLLVLGITLLVVGSIAMMGEHYRPPAAPAYRQKCTCREGVHPCDHCHADTGCYCIPSPKDGCCRANPNDAVELEPTKDKPCPCPGGYQCETCPYGPCHCHPTKGDYYNAIDAFNSIKNAFPTIEIDD
jgi:hypothetical protein